MWHWTNVFRTKVTMYQSDIGPMCFGPKYQCTKVTLDKSVTGPKCFGWKWCIPNKRIPINIKNTSPGEIKSKILIEAKLSLIMPYVYYMYSNIPLNVTIKLIIDFYKLSKHPVYEHIVWEKLAFISIVSSYVMSKIVYVKKERSYLIT